MPALPPPADLRKLRFAGLLFVVVLLGALAFLRSPLWRLDGTRPLYGYTPGDLFRCALAAGLLVAYAWGYRALRDQTDTAAFRRPVVGFAALFCLIGLAIPPFYSTDCFSNVNIGWTRAGHGLNPLVYALDEVPGWFTDPVFRPEVVWLHTPCAYGPLFVHVATALCRLGDGDRTAMVFLFKAFGVVVFGLTGWVVWRGVRRLGLPCPERALYLFLWNPLILLHGVIDGHNDLWMALLTAAGVYLAVGGGWRLAATAVVLAALVKYVSAAVLPFVVLYVARRVGWARSAAGAAAAVAISGLIAWPLLADDWHRIPFDRHAENAGIMTNSVPAMAYFPFELAQSAIPRLRPYESAVRAGVKFTFVAGFLAFYARLAVRRVRGPEYATSDFVRDTVLIQFVLACVVSAKFFPWYLGMFFPLALWLPEGDRVRRIVLAVACAQAVAITFLGQTRFLEAYLMTVSPILWVYGIRVRLPAWTGHGWLVRRAVAAGLARRP